MNIYMIVPVLLIVLAIITIWINSENSKVGVRIFWGVLAVLCCWGVAVIAAQIVRLNYNLVQ